MVYKIVLIFLIIVSLAISSADCETPFSFLSDSDKKTKKDNFYKKDLSDMSTSFMLPVPPISDNINNEKNKAKPQIVGRINNKVIVIQEGQKFYIKNGETIDGCLINYPHLICDIEQQKNIKEKQKSVLN